MRKKAYYTTAEIINNLYTTGNEWQLIDGTNYVGSYHKYTTGETYTGAIWDNNLSKQLMPYQEIPVSKAMYRKAISNGFGDKSIKTKYKSPNKSILTVTVEDRNKGFCYRYFIKKVNQFDIQEIDESQYNDWISKKIDPNLYTAVKITWYISGNIQDERSNNAVKKGVITKNLTELKRAEKSLSGISGKLTNLTEYYTDSDFLVPKDINK